MTDEPRPQAEESSATGGHEESDVGIGLITIFIIVFALIIAISMPLLWWLVQHWDTKAEKADPELPRLANLRAEPPRPRLQSTPAFDYQEFRDRQLSRLNGSGWVDREQRVVHIPIERAMELVLEEGLPRPARSESEDTAPDVGRASGNGERPARNTRENADRSPGKNPQPPAEPGAQNGDDAGNTSPATGDQVDR